MPEEAAPARKAGFGQLSLKGRALRYLAAREHSRAELERKLATHEEEPGQLARVLDELLAKGFISEQRVADSVVNRRQARLGTSRIKHELKSKGLGAEVVGNAVEALKATEMQRAKEVWRKKFGQPPQDATERGKQMRFLASRGFGADVLRRVVAGSDEEDCL
ncbi:MAG: recombination regulator RecX [Comamonadaceae bacterium]|nr:MAG: recombination regulator RecX [Comamonadaceae bacterium]